MRMGACCKFLDDLLVTAVDAIKDANRQPGILQVDFLERTVMLHVRNRALHIALSQPVRDRPQVISARAVLSAITLK